MNALNPKWLSIELQSIDLDIQNWNAGIRASYQAMLENFVVIDEPQTPRDNVALISGRKQDQLVAD